MLKTASVYSIVRQIKPSEVSEIVLLFYHVLADR